MARFRLLNLESRVLETFDLDEHPVFVAASHAWIDSSFGAKASDFAGSFGERGIFAVLNEYYPEIQHCWVDRLCINQQDKNDKLEQIPLMERIFKQAHVVVVLVKATIGAKQQMIDSMVNDLQEAFAMREAGAWNEQGAKWMSGPGYEILMRAMYGLSRLASTAWCSRIWTLQEYVLARTVVWIGLDLEPLTIDDYTISTLADICNSLDLEVTRVPNMRPIFTYLSGMANFRRNSIDRTRVMELLGDRFTKHEVDEIYGAMSASGVVLNPIANETKLSAWQRWCDEALNKGHARWALLPSNGPREPGDVYYSCAIPTFAIRHKLSSASCLDEVKSLGSIRSEKGCVTLTCRRIGSFEVVKRIGRVHEDRNGRLHRDITLILMTQAKRALALSIAIAFGSGGFDFDGIEIIAEILIRSYSVAAAHVVGGTEDWFQPIHRNEQELYVWNHFMSLQESQMIGLNEGIGYLCQVLDEFGSTMLTTVLVAGEVLPNLQLEALDFEARCADDRCVIMAVIRQAGGGDNVHKVGMTLPVPQEVCASWSAVPLTDVSIGGVRCFYCSESRVDASPRYTTTERHMESQHKTYRLAATTALQKYLAKVARKDIRGSLPDFVRNRDATARTSRRVKNKRRKVIFKDAAL